LRLVQRPISDVENICFQMFSSSFMTRAWSTRSRGLEGPEPCARALARSPSSASQRHPLRQPWLRRRRRGEYSQGRPVSLRRPCGPALLLWPANPRASRPAPRPGPTPRFSGPTPAAPPARASLGPPALGRKAGSSSGCLTERRLPSRSVGLLLPGGGIRGE
jgi:hypothetical protein